MCSYFDWGRLIKVYISTEDTKFLSDQFSFKRVIFVHRQDRAGVPVHAILWCFYWVLLKNVTCIYKFTGLHCPSQIFIFFLIILISKNLIFQEALSLILVPDIFLGLEDKNGNCRVNRSEVCVFLAISVQMYIVSSPWTGIFIKHLTFSHTFISLLYEWIFPRVDSYSKIILFILKQNWKGRGDLSQWGCKRLTDFQGRWDNIVLGTAVGNYEMLIYF